MAQQKSKKESESKSVATIPDKKSSLVHTLSADELPEGMTVDSLVSDAQEYGQEFSRSDVATPFLRILQALSPQIARKEQRVEGAEIGDFFVTASERVYKGEHPGIVVVPVHFERSNVEFRPNRGGFVRDHGQSLDPDTVSEWVEEGEKGRRVMKDGSGNTLQVGLNYYVLIVDEDTGDAELAAFLLTGKHIKRGRKWNHNIASYRLRGGRHGTFQPPSFFMSYRITTEEESNDKGAWFSPVIVPNAPTVKLPDGFAVYERAKELKGLVVRGDVKASVADEVDRQSREEDASFNPAEFGRDADGDVEAESL